MTTRQRAGSPHVQKRRQRGAGRLLVALLVSMMLAGSLGSGASAQVAAPTPAAPPTDGVAIGFNLESRANYPHDCRVTVTASGLLPRTGAAASYDVYVSEPVTNHATFLQERHRGVVLDDSGFVVVHFYVQAGRSFFVDFLTEVEGQVANVDRSATVKVPPTDGDCSEAGIPTPTAAAPVTSSETTEPDAPATTDATIAVALRNQPNDQNHCLATISGAGFAPRADATRVYETFIDDDGDGVFESYHSQRLVADDAGNVQFFIGVPKSETFYLAFRTEVDGAPVNYDRSETVTAPEGDCAAVAAEEPAPEVQAPTSPFELVFSPGAAANTCTITARGLGYAPGAVLWLSFDARNAERPVSGGGMNLTVQDDGTFDIVLAGSVASGLLVDARVSDGSADLHVVLEAAATCGGETSAPLVSTAPPSVDLTYAPGATDGACSVSARGIGFPAGAAVGVSHQFSGPNGGGGGQAPITIAADGSFDLVLDDDISNGWEAVVSVADAGGVALGGISGTVACASSDAASVDTAATGVVTLGYTPSGDSCLLEVGVNGFAPGTYEIILNISHGVTDRYGFGSITVGADGAGAATTDHRGSDGTYVFIAEVGGVQSEPLTLPVCRN